MAAVLTDTRYGRMLVRDDDKYIGKFLLEYGEFAYLETSEFSELVKPGMTVLDIGANIGVHTLTFSKLVGMEGRVYAYEAHPDNFYLLCANLALNNVQNVVPIQKACGDRHEFVPIPRLDLTSECNNYGSFSLVEKYTHCVDMVEMVPAFQDCHFMKIDVEGYETQVLLGASPMILRCKPWIHVENDRSEYADSVIETVRSLGYTPYWNPTPLFNPENHKKNPTDHFGGIFSIDMLCAPPNCTVTGGFEAVKGSWVNVFPENKRLKAA